jgi:hypothetical protein
MEKSSRNLYVRETDSARAQKGLDKGLAAFLELLFTVADP